MCVTKKIHLAFTVCSSLHLPNTFNGVNLGLKNIEHLSLFKAQGYNPYPDASSQDNL